MTRTTALPAERAPDPTDRRETYRRVIQAWQGQPVLVLGDVVADEHVVGRPLSIAREAPVLVLEEVERRILPGGATNLAANLAALGARVFMCGVVGDDETGRQLIRALETAGMDCSGVVVDPDRPTTTKTRIWGGGAQQQIQQLLVRLDRVERRTVTQAIADRMADHVRARLGEVAALMISDYENGVIQPGLIAASLPEALRQRKIVAVDSHGDLQRFGGATLFTPNQPEAEATLGRVLRDQGEVEQGGRELLERLQAQAVLITRGQEGMSLMTRDGQAVHLPVHTYASAVDPTGAGDTVAAAFTLGCASGARPETAAVIANIAAAIVVAQVGTAVATTADLGRAIESLV